MANHLPGRTCECGTMFRPKTRAQVKCNVCRGETKKRRYNKKWDNESVLLRMDGSRDDTPYKKVRLIKNPDVR